MATPLQTFRHSLGAQLHQRLGEGWRFYKSRLSLERQDEWGSLEISLNSVAKFSPWVDFSIAFQRRFAPPQALLGAVDGAVLDYGQNSHNRRFMKGLPQGGSAPGTWPANISQPVSEALVQELYRFIEHTVLPFDAHFGQPEHWREDLVAGRDSDGNRRTPEQRWRAVLVLDMWLGQPEQFRTWLAGSRLKAATQTEALAALARCQAVQAT